MSPAGRIGCLVLGVVLGAFLLVAGGGWTAFLVMVAAMVVLPAGIDALDRWTGGR